MISNRSRRARVALIVVAVTAVAATVYEARHARALGVPTLTTLAYSGSLLSYGAADNSSHLMWVAFFVAGANDGGLGSAACQTSPATIPCVSGQFSIPVSSCASVIQQNPNVQVELNIDGTAMGLTSVTAVPYALQAGQSGIPVVSSLPSSPSAGTLVYNSGNTSMSVYDGTTWQSFPRSGGATNYAQSTCTSSCTSTSKSQGATWTQTASSPTVSFTKQSASTRLHLTWTDSVHNQGSGNWCVVGIFMDGVLSPTCTWVSYADTSDIQLQGRIDCYITGVGAASHSFVPYDQSSNCIYGYLQNGVINRSIYVEEVN